MSCSRKTSVKKAQKWLEKHESVNAEFINFFIKNNETTGLYAIRVTETKNVIKVSFKYSIKNPIYIKVDYDTYLENDELKRLGLQEVTKRVVENGLITISVFGESVEIYGKGVGTLESTRGLTTIASEHLGEVPLAEMLENFNNLEKDEWAYQVSKDWVLVHLVQASFL
jgi:hypothetical protein